jgi:hypothetical protein
MAKFNYINTPVGELEYLLPNFESMMRGRKPEATANIANKTNVGTGYIDSIVGADAVLGQSTVDPRYGLSYQDNDNLNASILYDQDGREANINAGLLGGNAYANYIKDPANNSTLKVGYEEPRYGFSAAKNSSGGNEYRGNINLRPDTSLDFLKDDNTKKLLLQHYLNDKDYISGAVTNTDNGTGLNLGYNKQLTDDSNISAEAYKNQEDTGLLIKYLLNI